jgi:hypothetical protein
MSNRPFDADPMAEVAAQQASGGLGSDAFYNRLEKTSQIHTVDVQRETLKMQLTRQKREHENEVRRLDELLVLLEANPGTARILDLLGRR